MSRSNFHGVFCFMLCMLGCEASPQPTPPPASLDDKSPKLTDPVETTEAVVDGPSYRAAAQMLPEKFRYERIFSVPDGPSGLWIHRNPVMDGTNGPQGCAVDDDGSFWFVDSGDGLGTFTRFVHYSKKGKRLAAHTTRDHQLEGLLAIGGHLYSRDLMKTSLLRFSLEGKLEQEVAYSGVDSFARIADKVVAIRDFYPIPLPNASQDLTPSNQSPEFIHRGVRYLLARDSVQVGEVRTRIEEMPAIKFRGLLGVSNQGDLLVLMDDEQGPHTVLRFDAKGKLTGQAWVPNESVLFVPHPLCVDAQGNVFVTITREKHIDFVKLTFSQATL